MADAFKYDVFLSHSAKDKAVVRIFSLSASNGERAGVRCRTLHPPRKHLKVWCDEWMLKAGDSIPSKIEEGLEHSRVLASPAEASERRWMLCMSANAFGSAWVPWFSCSQPSTLHSPTTRVPLNKERGFIPLRLDDAPIKGSLAQFL